MNSPAPCDDEQRLEALRRYGILDTRPEEAFDGIARLAALACRAPIAAINFIDEGRQWFKSEIGLGVRETRLDVSICAHAILRPGLCIVPDTTKDERFVRNPLVMSDPHLRFYAGAPLETADGHTLGTLCVMDHVPRDLDEAQRDALLTLARQVMAQLELRRELAAQAHIQDELRRAGDAAERANRVLGESEERHRTILESISDGFFALGRDWRFTYVNPQAERILDRTPGELLGRNLWDEYPGMAGSEFERAYHRATDERVAVSFTSYYPDHDRWYEVHSYPAPDGLSVFFGDVTDRMRAEERERRLLEEAATANAKFRAIFEQGSLFAGIMAVNGTIIETNRLALEACGYTREQVVGRPFWECPWWSQSAALAERIRAASAQAAGGETFHAEMPYFVADGGERVVDFTLLPIKDETGRVMFLAPTGTDITDRNRAEERARFQAHLLDTVGQAVIVTDPQGRITYWNRFAETLYGWGADEATGRSILEIVVAEELAGRAAEIMDCMRAGEGWSGEFQVRRRDGTTFPAFVTDTPVFDERGSLVAIVGVSMDITGRKLTEKKLREQTRIAEALNRLGVLLAAELDLERLVQVATDEATRLTDARFGAFFYNVPDERGGSYTLYTISGVPREAFSRFPMPRATALFGPTFRNEGVVRLDDVTQDPRFGKNAPNYGMPEGHLPVRSYLAVTVVSRSGEVLGGLFFGHPEPGVFDESDERLVVGIAAQAAVAIDNARLYQNLQESERRFRHLADAMPQIVWVTRPDRSVEYVNRRWLDYTGQTPEEALGPGGWASAVHPEDLGRIVKFSVRSHATGEPFEAEYRIRDASGAYRWHLGRAVAVFDEAGRVVRRFGAATDIDDRRRAERDAHFLAEASGDLASIVDEASTLQRVARLAVPAFADWCSVDLAGEGGLPLRLAVAHVDPAKVELAHELHRRYPPDPSAPNGVAHVIRTGAPEMFPEITDDLIVAGARDEGHLRILRELGLKSSMCVPLKGRDGTLGAISFVAAESGRRYGPVDLRMAEDLASRAAIAIENSRLYSELKEADRRKNDFLATLAHELRNPLAPIRNTLHLLKGVNGDGPMEAERAMAERNVVHLARLIDDLMDVARINRGKIELSRQPVDLGTVVNQAVETARPLIDERRHHMTVSLPDGAVRLEADPTRLEQVLWNLLNNAAKYTEPGGQIRLSVVADGGEVVVRVRDTGIGIRPEMLPKVFDMFVQVGEHKDHAQGGLGIGLSLVRTLVQMHGGSIAAISDGPGRGSEFVVRLPVITAYQTTNAPKPSHRSGSSENPPRRRILVVDDNIDAARSLSRLLEKLYGQEVRVAHDGPEALAVAGEFHPEVVLLDIGLPGMDGNVVARRLREQPEFEKTLLVALTGWGQVADVERSRDAGFDHHLVKPANPDAIRGLLEEFEASSSG